MIVGRLNKDPVEQKPRCITLTNMAAGFVKVFVRLIKYSVNNNK